MKKTFSLNHILKHFCIHLRSVLLIFAIARGLQICLVERLNSVQGCTCKAVCVLGRKSAMSSLEKKWLRGSWWKWAAIHNCLVFAPHHSSSSMSFNCPLFSRHYRYKLLLYLKKKSTNWHLNASPQKLRTEKAYEGGTSWYLCGRGT